MNKCTKSKLGQAFSLIELMVVIAIVALLTAIAVPSYQGYLQQSKVTEIFSLASSQMNQWQQEYNLGSNFDVINPTPPATGIGSYIEVAELTDTTPTAIADCPEGGLAGGGYGVVCIQLVADTGIDPLLDDLVIYFTADQNETVATTGDSSNTTVGWQCNFVSTGDADDDATIESLLAPGSCEAD